MTAEDGERGQQWPSMEDCSTETVYIFLET